MNFPGLKGLIYWMVAFLEQRVRAKLVNWPVSVVYSDLFSDFFNRLFSKVSCWFFYRYSPFISMVFW